MANQSGTITSAQGRVTITGSPNDVITFTPTGATYTVEYPIGTSNISGATTTQTLTLSVNTQCVIWVASGSVAWSLVDNPDSSGTTVDAAGVLTAMQAMDTTQQTSARTAISAAQDLASVTLSAGDFSGGNINLSASAHANRTIFVNSNTAGLTLTLKDDATAGWADDDFVLVKMASGATGSAILIGAGGAGNSTLTTGTGASASTATAVGGAVFAQRTGSNAFTTLSATASSGTSGATLNSLFRNGFGGSGPQYAGSSTMTSIGAALSFSSVVDTSTSGVASVTDGGAGAYGWRARLRQTAAVAAASRATGLGANTAGRRVRFDATSGGNLPLYMSAGIADANTVGTFLMALIANSGGMGGTWTGVEPSAVTTVDFVGVGADSTDTNLYVYHNDNAGSPTKVDLGASFPKSQWVWYDMTIESISGGSSLRVTVTNCNTLASTAVTISSNLPRNTQDYFPGYVRSATATAASFVEAPKLDIGWTAIGTPP